MKKSGLFLSCLFLVFNLLFIVVSPSFAQENSVQNGGFLNIEQGNIVEGSSRFGGIQPDYYVDVDHPHFKKFLKKARKIGKSSAKFWHKIDQLNDLVGEKTFKFFDYDDPRYLRLLEQARDSDRPVKLSEYFKCQAGVCREYGLFTHIALKEAGIANKFVYAEIHRASNYDDYNIVEDHAFVVVKHKGVEWVVDPYYWGFNGFRLEDLLSKEGITIDSKTAPIAEPAPGFRRIIKINDFPKVWTPSTEKPGRCEYHFAFAI